MRHSDDARELDTAAVLRGVSPGDGDYGADPLAFFESEEGPDRQTVSSTSYTPGRGVPTSDVSPAAPIEPASQAMGHATDGTIALDQVRSRLGHVAWAEAVAIVDGLCGVLLADGAAFVPEMSHVSITAGGTVNVRAGGTRAPAAFLARMLHTFAEGGAVPAPLRLFVAKWVSAGPEHSIAEFAKEIAYFARPDGPALIQAVYERAMAAPPRLPVPQPKRDNKPSLTRLIKEREASRSRPLYGVAAGIVVAGIVLTGVFAWRGAWPFGGAPTSNSPTIATGDAGEALAPPPTSAAPLGVNDRETAAGSRPQAVSGPAPAARTASPPTGPRTSTRQPGSPAPISSAVRASLAATGVPSPRTQSDSLEPGTLPQGTFQADAPDTQGQGSPIYSSADAGVTPPAFLHPQLPAQLLSGLRPDMNTIEVIVSENGTVERVKLLSSPKRMADMMLLSGAKTWEFQPAVRDGRSVRYRLELSWPATP